MIFILLKSPGILFVKNSKFPAHQKNSNTPLQKVEEKKSCFDFV